MAKSVLDQSIAGFYQTRPDNWSLPIMQSIATIALVVADYDEAIEFYCGKLGFALLADQDMGQGKRWVLVAPRGGNGGRLLLAKAVGAEQQSRIGNQTGGRVFLFLETDDFARDHAAFLAKGVAFHEAPRHEPYGTVAVFEDIYGNGWDLIEPKPPA
jgi:catechol 2,3-dioxygenase-like lactoylglutathione lyase family enzyme